MSKPTETTPTLPMTVAQAAKLWGLNPSRVRQLVDQDRVKHMKVGKKTYYVTDKETGRRVEKSGAETILIMQLERPERVAPGTLSGTRAK